MLENAHLNGCLDEINLGFVEREATSQFLTKLGIQLYLAGLSLSNTVSILEIFGVERARSSVHNWVHRADLQIGFNQNPDHVAIDETVIRFNDEQYWLYAAVDPKTNRLLYTRLKSTKKQRNHSKFFAELCKKYDVDNAVSLIADSHLLKDACQRHSFDFRYEKHGSLNSIEHIF